MRAEDVLPDNINHVTINGIPARKGTVAAFLANARIFTNPAALPEERRTAEQHIIEALPTLRALGLLDVLEVRDPALRAFVEAH